MWSGRMQTFEICLLLAVLSQVTLFVTAATCAVSDSDQATFSADGVCDSGLNTDGCGWDGGDCCRQSCVEPFDTNGCPRDGVPFNCLDPKYSNNEASFATFEGGVCTDQAGYCRIEYYDQCERAAALLGLSDTKVGTALNTTSRVAGCYHTASGLLRFNEDFTSEKSASSDVNICILCSDTSTTTTTAPSNCGYSDCKGVPLYKCSLDQCVDLSNIYLGANSLTGTIPESIGVALSSTLVGALRLDGNQLSGTIPSSIGSLTLLDTLYLQRNLLTGTIPPSICCLIPDDATTATPSGFVPRLQTCHISYRMRGSETNDFSCPLPSACADYLAKVSGVSGCGLGWALDGTDPLCDGSLTNEKDKVVCPAPGDTTSTTTAKKITTTTSTTIFTGKVTTTMTTEGKTTTTTEGKTTTPATTANGKLTTTSIVKETPAEVSTPGPLTTFDNTTLPTSIAKLSTVQGTTTSVTSTSTLTTNSTTASITSGTSSATTTITSTSTAAWPQNVSSAPPITTSSAPLPDCAIDSSACAVLFSDAWTFEECEQWKAETTQVQRTQAYLSAVTAAISAANGCAQDSVGPAPAPSPIAKCFSETDLFNTDSVALTQCGSITAALPVLAGEATAAFSATFDVAGNETGVDIFLNNRSLPVKKIYVIVEATTRPATTTTTTLVDGGVVAALGGTTNTILVFTFSGVGLFLLVFGIAAGALRAKAQRDKKRAHGDSDDITSDENSVPSRATTPSQEKSTVVAEHASQQGSPRTGPALAVVVRRPATVPVPARVKESRARAEALAAKAQPQYATRQPQSVRDALRCIYATSPEGDDAKRRSVQKITAAGAPPPLYGIDVGESPTKGSTPQQERSVLFLSQRL
eukprot:INCI9907.11.p1 GENE.INCI9907.11~~INCI9907.11.p1  ORF type:complete len:866 (+),score=106.04 INCI9907.11:110-2707(+)